MRAIPFPEQTAVLAKDQPEYNQLPVYIDTDESKAFISCHQLTLRERLIVLFTGKLWHFQLTFGGLYHPTKLDVECPFDRKKKK